MNIRPATADDLTALARIQKAAFEAYVPEIGKAPAPMVVNLSAQLETYPVFVAETETGIAGYLILDDARDPPLLDTIAVDPAEQGQGVGGALIGHMEDRLRAEGCRRYVLYTNAKMTKTLALYRRRGYTETRHVVEDGYERIYFEKAL
ncbi:MAG: GNAT family N-acetyltransferase [Alphaproteobacteria bacterium]|nr:GNAT family N-acetyltransferase [Alphaproteobacteria bacterium]